MSSKVQIVNMALGHLGQGPTESLSPDTVRDSARKVLIFADTARDMVTGEHDWLDMRLPVVLNPLSLPGLLGWAFAYGLPERFVRVSELTGCTRWEVGLYVGTDGDNNRIEQKVIYSTSALSSASVVVSVDWETLSPPLALAVSFKMAWLAAVSVLGSSAKSDGIRRTLNDDYLEACRDAARIEAFNSADPGDRIPGFQDYRRQAI